MLPANEGRRYIVTSSLISWAQTQNDPCFDNLVPSRDMQTVYETGMHNFAEPFIWSIALNVWTVSAFDLIFNKVRHS